MKLTRYLIPLLLGAVVAGALPAQTLQEPPRFDGNRTTASSVEAVSPTDGQRTANPASDVLLNALIGSAIDEAAREEGRVFIEERRLDRTETEAD